MNRRRLAEGFGILVLLAAQVIAQNGLWQPLLPSPAAPAQPPVRYGAAVAYDAARDRIVLTSGRRNVMGSIIRPQETWEFDGVDWSLIAANGPIAFAGYDDSTNVKAYYDTWLQAVICVESAQGGPLRFLRWNGATWTTIATAPQTTFPWRMAFDVVYDPVRGVAVLFGGYTGNAELNDTWEFDGTTLTMRMVPAPPPRWGHAMAYDADRGVVVMYGGRNGPQLSDMWDWNGTAWTPTPHAVGPGPRSFHGLAYDIDRSRLVLVGNYGTAASSIWEWQPSGWTQSSASNSARSHMGLVYDSLRARLVSSGGTNPSLDSGSTSTFGFSDIDDFASLTPFGIGCAGPAGVPVLQSTDLPVLGTTMSMQVSNVPNGPINLVFGFLGFDATMWNGIPLPVPLDPLFPGCTAYLAPQAGFSLGLGPSGTVPWLITIPFIPAISGVPFYLQAGVLVLGYNPGGLVFSNALAAAAGR